MRGVWNDAVLSSLLLQRWTGQVHGGGSGRTTVVSHDALVRVEENRSGGRVVGVVVYRRGGDEWPLLK